MDDQNTDTHNLNGKSPEFRTELAKQLEDLVPEAIADGKVDVAKLKELLDTDAGDTSERFGLFWPGKKHAMRAAQDPTTATLKPAKSESKDWDTTENIFIEGDNLEVLKVLQKQYHNSIKMIYIDPPYNTGKDFVYPDNFKEGLQNYLEFSKQVDEGNKKISTNTETAGRYHSNWLNMMYPRLKLARNLLTDDGAIFVSIDNYEVDNLRKILDEIFGESNFQCKFVWLRKTSPKGVPPVNMVVNSQEYVLCYSRSDKFKFIGKPRSREGFSNPDNDPRGPWRNTNIKSTIKDKSSAFTIVDPETGNKFSDAWAFSQAQLQIMIEQKQIIFPKNPTGQVRAKEYFKEFKNSNTPIITFLDKYDGQSASDGLTKLMKGKYFPNPKNVTLLNKLVSYFTEDGETILDFFSGSGTTAHAVMQLNAEDGGSRKHIQVQLPEPTDEKSEAYKAGYRKISDIARERINRAGEKIKTDYADKLAERDTPLDVGYRTYKLSDTNFTKWKSEATKDLGELQLRLDSMKSSSNDNASEEDLLVEVMLKMGLPLTARTAVRDVAGLSVHQVVADADDSGETADAQPVFYLNEHVKPDLAQLRAIVTELTPSKFVILDDAFQGDNELKTNLVQTCKSYEVELWTV